MLRSTFFPGYNLDIAHLLFEGTPEQDVIYLCGIFSRLVRYQVLRLLLVPRIAYKEIICDAQFQDPVTLRVSESVSATTMDFSVTRGVSADMPVQITTDPGTFVIAVCKAS